MRCARALLCRTLPEKARNVLFFGGDLISLATLKAVHARARGDGGRLEVVHPPAPAPVKKGDEALNPVQAYCREQGIVAHCVDHPKSIGSSNFKCPWPNARDEYDATVVSSCRYFLPKKLLDALPPAINMHPSLLPKYRGASPIFETLRRGDAVGGISVIKLESRFLMDCGDVLLQKDLALSPSTSYREYFPVVAEEGAQAVVRVLDHFAESWARAVPQPNNELHFTKDPLHAPLLPRNPGRLNWETMSGNEARNTWRAFVGYAQVSAFFCKAATPCARNIKCDTKKRPVSAVFNEVLHPETMVSDAVRRELDIVAAQATPGAAYFPYTRNTDGSVVGAVKCREGWLLYSSLTLKNGAPQPPATVAATAECRLGTVYNGVFVSQAPC